MKGRYKLRIFVSKKILIKCFKLLKAVMKAVICWLNVWKSMVWKVKKMCTWTHRKRYRIYVFSPHTLYTLNVHVMMSMYKLHQNANFPPLLGTATPTTIHSWSERVGGWDWVTDCRSTMSGPYLWKGKFFIFTWILRLRNIIIKHERWFKLSTKVNKLF